MRTVMEYVRGGGYEKRTMGYLRENDELISRR